MKLKYILLIVLSLIGLTGCGLINQKINYLKSGDFEYMKVYVLSNGGRNETTGPAPRNSVVVSATITGLTESGKNKEIIIIPRKIDGLSVDQIGCGLHRWRKNYFISSEKLKRLYIPFEVRICDATLLRCKNLQSVCMLSKKRYYPNEETYAFITSYYYHHNTEKHYNEDYANVSFMYNYDTYIDDGYYWIDNYDYGSLIEYVPYDPVRPGYTFGGWYKEKECINKWDFAVDALPEEKLDENREVLYQETILYARWIEE